MGSPLNGNIPFYYELFNQWHSVHGFLSHDQAISSLDPCKLVCPLFLVFLICCPFEPLFFLEIFPSRLSLVLRQETMEKKPNIVRFPFPTLIYFLLFNGYEKNKRRLELFRGIMELVFISSRFSVQADQNCHF